MDSFNSYWDISNKDSYYDLRPVQLQEILSNDHIVYTSYIKSSKDATGNFN